MPLSWWDSSLGASAGIKWPSLQMEVSIVSGCLLAPPLWVTNDFFPFRGGRTETGLALKYLLRKGFPGGRNASVPQVLIIVTDGRSQGHVSLPAKQLQDRGVIVFAVGVRFPR